MTTTLVTAYYNIPSKFKKERYLEWGHNILKLESPIVLFTEEHLVEEIKAIRKDKPIKIISIPFTSLEAWTLYSEKWIEHHKIDPENSYHTPELYAIWAQKAFFVETAISINPFNTDFFFWCDFGAFRDTYIPTEIIETFPMSKYLPKDKIILQSLIDLDENEKILQDDRIYGSKEYIWHKALVVGGLWGGGKEGCLKWKEAYQKMLEKYFEAGRFSGKDQRVMLSTYLENPDLALVVKSTLSGINQWFFFEYLLSSLNVKFELNSTYIIDKSNYSKNDCSLNQGPVVSVKIMGGLGNQMFELATAYAYTVKYNGKLQIRRNKIHSDGRELYWNSVCRNFNKYLVDDLPDNLMQWYETGPTVYTELPALNDNGLYIHGYLQSSKYFYNDDIKKEIRELFQPSTDVMNIITNRYSNLLNNKDNIVVVHARRTDYLRNQDIINFHGPLTVEYYKEAIKRISKKVHNPVFLLSSDDVNFWFDIMSEIPELTKESMYILNNESDINTLALLQQFHYFIIANSTFSWWASWLANDVKSIIAPSKWFGPTGPQNYQDIYEDNWEVI